MAILRWRPPNKGFECNGVWQNHDFQPISRFISGMSYYGKRIGNPPKLSNIMLGLPSVNPDFKVVIIQRQINKYKWPTRKSYAYIIYRTAPCSMTLILKDPQFQGHAIFDARISQNISKKRTSRTFFWDILRYSSVKDGVTTVRDTLFQWNRDFPFYASVTVFCMAVISQHWEMPRTRPTFTI